MKLPIIILLFVTLGLAGLVYWQNQGEEPGAGGSTKVRVGSHADAKLPEVPWEQIHGIEISDASGSVELRRESADDGSERWVVANRFGYPIQERTFTQLREGLGGFERARFVGRSESTHKTCGVDEGAGKKLRLLDSAGKALLEVIVGRQDTSGGRTYTSAGTFVRPVGKDEVFSHRGRISHTLHTTPRMWLDNRMVRIEPKDANDLVGKAQKVIVEFDDIEVGKDPEPDAKPDRLRVMLVREKAEAAAAGGEDIGPTLPGQAPKATEELVWKVMEPESGKDVKVYRPFVEAMVRTVYTGRIDDVAGRAADDAKYGFDKPVADVTIHFEDGASKRLVVGNRAPLPEGDPRKTMKLRYARVGDEPWVTTIHEFSLRTWMRKPADLENKMAQQPVPQPGGGKIPLPGTQPAKLPGGQAIKLPDQIPPKKKTDDGK